MKKSRADFDWNIDGSYILIEDLNGDNVSVTNDVENVIHDINQWLLEIGHDAIDSYAVLYADSTGQIDAIITRNNEFSEFRGVGATTFYEAKRKYIPQ